MLIRPEWRKIQDGYVSGCTRDVAVITLYGLKNCDTCRKALKALAAAGCEPAFVDIRVQADLAAKLPAWLAALGAGALVNTRSATWRALDERARVRVETDPMKLLAEHPTLIRRPVIESKKIVTAGWTPAVRDALQL